MFYVTGSNLFGQWFTEELIFNQFRTIHTNVVDLSIVKILEINWSYNILQVDNTLWISGAWNGKEKQCVKIPLPPELKCNETSFQVSGNDNNIIASAENVLWVLDLSMNDEIKKINLNIEMPIEDTFKKKRITNCIKKIVVTHESCLYLTMEGNVYNGVLPSYVDTSHCVGKVLDIACGYEHFVLLSDAGRVYTWGNGRRLQLGHGDVSNLESPTEVDALAGIKISKICAGGWHSLALSEFGDLYAWGWNDTGQLGIRGSKKESLKSHAVPTLVDLFDDNGQVNTNIKDIACGSKHSAILLEDNSVWTSGYNKYGQLGISEEKYQSVNCFQKIYQVHSECVLMCGPWTTIIIENE